MKLNQQVALVTGASSGIGAAVARALAAEGAAVAVNYPREHDEAPAQAVADEIRTQGGTAELARFDVTDEAQVKDGVAAVAGTLGPVDILVNNAGIANAAPVHRMRVEQWDQLLAVHVRGVFLTTRAVLPAMYERGSGRIINTASQLAYSGAPGFAHYTAAKGAIISFTRSLALELGSSGVTANCVAPGATETPMLADVPEDVLEGIRQAIPVQRIATVDDIAPSYVFLASPEARHYQGQCLSPNGGDVFL
ncbi:MAG: SDR family NAD(P)-dependent oxidoreductase [Pseudomonadota bacterium]